MFLFSRNTEVCASETLEMTEPVRRFISILERDRDKVFFNPEGGGDAVPPKNRVVLCGEEMDKPEQYHIKVEEEQIYIYAGDDLGLIYGILELSGRWLGVKPFWFYMDQEFQPAGYVEIPLIEYRSVQMPVRFRGWFINDEVLMMGWKYNQNGVDGWEMALEALLRCGGNMVIAGTDEMSRKNRKLAAEMGLWITHHHAEPLGAEMFARAYPGEESGFLGHEMMYYKLWEDAVIAQKDYKVVWNLCFRGQGDKPFWADDSSGRFSTPEARGALIGDVIRKQREIVMRHVENPVFCTNLYGEVMELYRQGYLELDPDVIRVHADNGYGKMVTRRRNNHNPRIVSMPDPGEDSPQGIYYHVSFYDLQAGNHITMLPNSVSFVDRELSEVLENGGSEFWIVNCSNIRPHVYFLDAVRKKWEGGQTGDESHSREFAEDYFGGSEAVAASYRAYPNAMIPFGPEEDEHMGEQYYAENLRVLANSFFVDREKPAESLRWIERGNPEAPARTLTQQAAMVCAPCVKGLSGLRSLLECCEAAAGALRSKPSMLRLFSSTLLLQARIHAFCAEGVTMFAAAWEAYNGRDYETAFVRLGDAAGFFDKADKAMKESEYGVWEDFYKNDCLADIRYTGYMIRKMMGAVRELGDGAYHDRWQRKYMDPDGQGVVLLMFKERHMTDQELYLAMKNRLGG